MEPVQITPKTSQDIAKLPQGVDRAQVALDALRESNLSSDQVKQLEALLKTVSPTEGAASATTSEAVAELKLVDGHQAVVGKTTVNGEQLDTLLSEGSFNNSRSGQHEYAAELDCRMATRAENRAYVDSLLAKEEPFPVTFRKDIPPMKPNTITLNPDEELAEILSRCRFVARLGTRCFGQRFAVELCSRSRLQDRIGNVHLRIVPLVPLASTDEAFLELAMDAHREMCHDQNPGVAAHAQEALERLRGERLPAGALEHRRIMLWQGDTSYEATTDEDGEADFPGVELDKECSLSMDAVKASNVLTDG